MQLLLVEDDPALQRLLRWELEDCGYRVTTAGSCRGARTAIRQRRYEYALLDYHLGDGASTELIGEFRRANPEAPIVLCSGQASPGTIGSVGQGHRVPFLTKPVDIDHLHRLLQSQQQRAAVADREPTG